MGAACRSRASVTAATGIPVAAVTPHLCRCSMAAGSQTISRLTSGSAMLRASNRTARAPIARNGWAAAVSGGVIASARSRSSKDTRAMSLPMTRFTSRSASRVPDGHGGDLNRQPKVAASPESQNPSPLPARPPGRLKTPLIRQVERHRDPTRVPATSEPGHPLLVTGGCFHEPCWSRA
jgi:hypothetical protein